MSTDRPTWTTPTLFDDVLGVPVPTLHRDGAEQRAALAAARLTVADLTEEHRGWLVKVEGRTFLLARARGHATVRRWTTPDGEARVGLLSTEGRETGWAGTEHHYPATTPAELVRRATR